MNSFAIDPYGRMSVCVISQQETYDTRSGSVREGWEQFLLAVRNRKRTRLTKCTQCRIQSICGMCPANGELENGDKESPVEFLCETAHLRAATLGIDVAMHGDCEFCAGEGAERVRAAAARIRSRETNVDDWSEPVSLLPVLNQAGSRTGCGSCGTGH